MAHGSQVAEVSHVAVVVPARDEEVLLPRCLAALGAAVDRLGAEHPSVTIDVVVVADRCRDRTVSIAVDAGAHVVEVDEGLVGAARRAGVTDALLRVVSPTHAWLASTDADTVVQASWLTDHLALAAAGADLVLGRAVPDGSDLDPIATTRWGELHPVRPDRPYAYVHGANLGVRMDAYLAAGGWPPLGEHEDLHLVEALWAAGTTARVGPDVTTSARRDGRTPGGYAGYLRALLIETTQDP